jgi:hypothetical protein
MSAEQDRVRALAERIAQRVSHEADDAQPERARTNSDAASNEELAAVRASLAELKRKLANIEEHLARESVEASSNGPTVGERPHQAGASNGARSPWLSGVYVPAAHPSQERFGVEEAAVSELVDFFEKEKVCELEPGGKPCTHCDMCSTRGF